MRRTTPILSFGLVVFLFVGTQYSAAQAPAAPTPTLWRFLGIPQAASKINAQLFNRRGNKPGMETKPPLKALSDPANLAPDMPKAIQAAAKIKQAEDLAPQKKKAIKYLASIGCGCYDIDGEVTAALVAAMTDCTESVRLEAMRAIQTAASEDPCCNCGSKCCCNKDILEMLAQRAYRRGDDGCYVEPSARVRQAAIDALMVCCTTQEPIEILDEEQNGGGGIERPADESEADDLTDEPPAPPADNDDHPTAAMAPFSLSSFIDAGKAFQPEANRNASNAEQASAVSGNSDPTRPEMQKAAVVEKLATVIPRRGHVTYVDVQKGTARVKFDGMGEVPERTIVRAYHKFFFSTSDIGQFVVLAWNDGEAVVRRVDGLGVGKLARGDTIIVK